MGHSEEVDAHWAEAVPSFEGRCDVGAEKGSVYSKH